MLTCIFLNVTDLNGRSDSKYPNFYIKYKMFYIFHSVNYNSIITIQAISCTRRPPTGVMIPEAV